MTVEGIMSIMAAAALEVLEDPASEGRLKAGGAGRIAYNINETLNEQGFHLVEAQDEKPAVRWSKLQLFALAAIVFVLVLLGYSLGSSQASFLDGCQARCEAAGQVLRRAEVRSQGGAVCACAPRGR